MGETPETGPETAAEQTTEPTETTTEPDKAEAPKPDSWENNTGKGGKEAVLADLKAERKARQEAEKKLRSFEDANKSDLEKATSSAEREKERADTAERELIRLRVIAATGLPPDLQEFLGDGEEVALTERAKKLMAAVGTKPGTPRPDPSQGAKGKGPDIDSQIADAQSKGDVDRFMRLQTQKLREQIVGNK